MRTPILDFSKVGPESFYAWWRKHAFLVQRNTQAGRWYLAVDGHVVGRFDSSREAIASAQIYTAQLP